MTVPEAVHVTHEGRQVVHVMTDGVLIPMGVTEAQLFQVRLGKAIEAATAADAPQRGPGRRAMSQRQSSYMHALLGEQGITGTDRHAVLSRIVGRTITSANDLDAADASKVIDALQTTASRRRAAAPNDQEPF